MNSKRILVISGVAVLAVLLVVAAFLAFPRLAKGDESIAVFGYLRDSDSQFLAAKGPQPILAHGYIRYNDPELLAAKDPQPILAHGPIRYGAPQIQSVPDRGANSQWVPAQEFIPVR